VCAKALTAGGAELTNRFGGGTVRETSNAQELAAFVSRRNARVSASAGSPRVDASETRASVVFPASASYRDNFGRGSRVDMSILAIAELRDNDWVLGGCRITGTPQFP
jgi:hypothetical protein